MMRRLFEIVMLVLLLCVCESITVTAQTFPAGRVTFVVPFQAGGPGDILARGLANELANLWNQPVIVENIGGAGGLVGTGRVAKAAPDGYTLLVTVQETLVQNRFLFKNLPYDPDKGLVPITMIARSPLFVLANPSLPANSMDELFDLARKGRIAYGSSGLGSATYLFFEALAKREGVKFVHVPYRGMAPVLAALMSGEIQMTTGGTALAGPMLEEAKVKALAISGYARSKLLPNVPTLAEAGISDIDTTTWWGLFAPEGTDAALVDRINRDVATVARRPDFVARYFEQLRVEPVLNSPAEFAANIRKDVEMTAETVKAIGLKPQD